MSQKQMSAFRPPCYTFTEAYDRNAAQAEKLPDVFKIRKRRSLYMAVLEVRNLKKIYRTRFGGNQVQALSCVNFSVEEGEYVAIMEKAVPERQTL